MTRPTRAELIAALQRDWQEFLKIVSDLTLPMHARMLAWRRVNWLLRLLHRHDDNLPH